MLPATDICERARLSRDPRFDGRFFVAVLTTGIYCRPVCPARPPAPDNVRYYPSAAAAEAAGYRPCLRCRPEAAARIPEWSLASRAVIQGLRLIDAGFLDDHDTAELAGRLGMTQRHLNRLFHHELGASPKGLAMVRRRALAKRLVDETRLTLAEVALRAGYRSLRRFNDDFQRCYGRSPRSLRFAGGRRRPAVAAGACALRLPVREPFNAPWVFDFLRRRALIGFETVAGLEYRRRIFDADGSSHWIAVRWANGCLHLQVPAECRVPLSDVLPRVRRVFDLDADPRVVDEHLGADPLLAPVVAEHRGLRVPGAWDPFETAVRAVLGQQVSVDRATALAHRLLERYGEHVLQSPAALARANPAEVGMPGRRGEAIRSLAREVEAGRLELHEGVVPERLQQGLCALPGIGPWTAGYVAMRVAKDPDAYPAEDWVVLKTLAAAEAGAPARGARLRANVRAEAWRPWRAYAVMYLWKLAGCLRDRQAAKEA